MRGAPKIVAVLLLVAAAVLIVAGVVTWGVITNNLAAERITVSDDASCAAGDTVNGPISAFCMAQVIDHHALEATGGKTYAELGQDDPLRNTAMQASFLRASLFTSVVAYGVAAFAVGMGVVLALLGIAVRVLDQRTSTPAGVSRAAST